MSDKNILLDGKIIKRRRLSLKMSQSELAKDITTQATISQIENANRVPNIAILLEILARLNLDFDILKQQTSSPRELELFFTKILSNEDKNTIAVYLLESIKQRDNIVTGVYKHVLNALDYFYAKDSDYLKACQNLELAITDTNFRNISSLSKYVVYQYLALSEYHIGFCQLAKNYFNQMIRYEPKIDSLDDIQFRCILQVRKNYIDFLIENSEYQLSEYYLQESISWCKSRFTVYKVSDFYRQLAHVHNQQNKSEYFLKYMNNAAQIDTLFIQ